MARQIEIVRNSESLKTSEFQTLVNAKALELNAMEINYFPSGDETYETVVIQYWVDDSD